MGLVTIGRSFWAQLSHAKRRPGFGPEYAIAFTGSPGRRIQRYLRFESTGSADGFR